MSKEKPYTKAELCELIKAYEDDSVRSAIHKNNPKIAKLAEQLGRKVRGVESQLLEFHFIEKHLNGQEPSRKKYSKNLFDVWIESGIEDKLALEKRLTIGAILRMTTDRALKTELLIAKALEFYDSAKEEKSIWAKKRFADSDGGPIAHFDRWLIEAAVKKEENIGQLPAELKRVVAGLDFRDIKKVIAFAEQFRLLDSLSHDPVFKGKFQAYDEGRKKSQKKALLDDAVKESWDARFGEGGVDENAERFTRVWEMFNPLKNLATEAHVRAISLSPNSEPQKVFVSEHVESQGPKYLAIGEVMKQQTIFEIPPYQRSYEWDRSNIEILREDLDSCTMEEDAPPVFLGTLLFQVGPPGSDTTEVLDGQQRMLTITLFCIWACRLLRQVGQNKLAEIIVTAYLGNLDPVHGTMTPKFKPDPKDQASLKALLSSIAVAEFAFDGWVEHNVARNSNALEKQFKNIDDVLGPYIHTAGIINSPHALCDLLLRLLQVCHVCRFVLASKDDPFDTFQRLNYRGKKLQNADLVRSVVLKKCTTSEIDSFYRKKWIPVEEMIAVGELTDPDAEYKKSNLDKFFTCFAKTRIPGTKKNQSVSQLTKYWAKIDASTVNKIPKELVSFARLYNLIFNLNENVVRYSIDEFGLALTQDIVILAKTGIPDDFGPFVIGMLEALEGGECKKQDVSQSIRLLSSWVVRNSVCATGASTLFGLQRVFNANNWESFKSSGFSADVLFEQMDKKEFGLDSLTDGEFRDRIANIDVYNLKVSHALVLALDTSSTQHGVGLALHKEDNRLKSLGRFQIDHIAPQKVDGAKDWKHMVTHKELIHTVGNLVPVEDRLNREAQREGFEKRANRFQDKSVYKMARDLKAQLLSTSWQQVYGGTWGHKLITDRNETFAEILTESFAFPYQRSRFNK